MRHLGILAALFAANAAFAEPAVDVQARIFSYFLERAEKGDASSQFIVGFRYESGSGTERDMKKAMNWYAKAAAQGHEQARERIGAPASQPPAPVAAPAPQTVAKPAQAPAPAPKVVAKVETKKAPEITKPKAKAAPKPAPAVASAAAPATKRADASHAMASATTPTPVPRPSPVLVPAASSEKPATSAMAAAEPATTAAPVASTTVTNTETVAQSAPEKKPVEAPAINALEVVLNGKWARNEVAPDYLPSSNTSCLRAGSERIVCFSGGAQAHVDGNAVMYAVKSTLSDFSPNGTFRVQYVFNVTDVTADPNASASDPRDLFGLASRLGWQEPGLTLDCGVNDAGRITCLRNGRQQLTFYRR